MGMALSRWSRPGCLLAPLLLFAGCSGPDKEPGSALWVEPEDVALVGGSLLSRVADAHIRELFVPLADLGAGGALKRRAMPELPSLPLTVVVAGSGRDLPKNPRAITEDLRRIFADVEALGAVPSGVHFDLDGLGAVENGAAFFKKLRRELDAAFVSLTLRHSWVDDPKLLSLGDAVDFVVPFLYGQREDEPEAKEAWDLDVVRQRLERLEKAGVPYLLGVSGVGTATRKGPTGEVESASTEHAPHTFMWNRGLRLKPGIDPDDAGRPVYTLVAENGARAGGWEIEPSDEIRLVWPTTPYLDKLLDAVAQGGYRRLLGQLYYRLPAAEEGLSITVENIVNALAAGPVDPDLEVEVSVSRRGRRNTRFRFVVSSSNGEATEYSLLGNNYLQVKTDTNSLGRVDLGNFYRYDILHVAPDGKAERVMRNSNTLRLHVPVVEGHQRVESGDVVIHRRSPELEIEGKFLMPDGRTLALGPYTWKEGKLQGSD